MSTNAPELSCVAGENCEGKALLAPSATLPVGVVVALVVWAVLVLGESTSRAKIVISSDGIPHIKSFQSKIVFFSVNCFGKRQDAAIHPKLPNNGVTLFKNYIAK